jgi:hypothetical protein
MGTLKKFRIVGAYSVKISQLCKMIEDSIHSGKYPLDDQQKRFANSVKVTNRSEFDDLKSSEIIIEVRIKGLYITSNYVPNIEHLPGIVEVDVLDLFKILCRRLERMTDSAVHPKRENLHTYTNLSTQAEHNRAQGLGWDK